MECMVTNLSSILCVDAIDENGTNKMFWHKRLLTLTL